MPPLEQGDYIDDLVPTNPAAIGDSSGKGDDHLRLIKKCVQQSFPNIGGAVTLTHDELNALPGDLTTGDQVLLDLLRPHLPQQGMITMWSGLIANIPTGWALCDGGTYSDNDGGNVTTPDMQDRFVVGAGNSYTPSETGGANTKTTSTNGSHTHSTGSHALTPSELPNLTNYIKINRASGSDSDSHHNVTSMARGAPDGTASSVPMSTPGLYGYAHNHGATGTSGNHTHTVDNRPQYFAVAYIMKVHVLPTTVT